ncbi:MAG: DUF1810 domain-containing protein [Cytophagaceae bacterium]|nr:DUF1810 domain-containing protein [Cytophagaceae bacterium]
MDSFNLNRFLLAQEDTYEQALLEIQAGKKKSHWMWFIFPQMKGLGTSFNSTFYGISGQDEAEAYLAHPVLGSRLIEISKVLLTHADKPIEQILGQIDALKLESCMELFASVPACNPVFDALINSFFCD